MTASMPPDSDRAIPPHGASRHVATRWLGVVVRLLVLVGAVAFVVRGVAWRDVASTLARTGWALPALVVALNGLMMALKAVRLRILLHPRRLSFVARFVALLTSSAVNNVTPFRGGDVGRLWLLERTVGISKTAAAAVAVVENLLELLIMALIAFASSFLASGQRWASVVAPVVAVASAGLLLVLRKTSRQPGAGRMAPGARPALLRQAWGWASRLGPGARSLAEARLWWPALGLSLAIVVSEMAMVVVCGRAVGLVVTPALAAVVLLGINLALAVPSTPAGVGPFEGATVAVVLLAGLAKGSALAFAVLYHALHVVPVTVAGLATVALAPRRPAQASVREPR